MEGAAEDEGAGEGGEGEDGVRAGEGRGAEAEYRGVSCGVIGFAGRHLQRQAECKSGETLVIAS